MEVIPYGKQFIDEDDIDAVITAMRGELLTQGMTLPKFEKKIADYCGSSFAVAANSATSSLHLACMALGLKEGDLVWVSSISFVASANCAKFCGADIDFVDIEAADFNMSCSALLNKFEQANNIGRMPKILIVVHMAGYSADMKKISELCNNFGVKIIEDASHALGSGYEDSKVGSCQYSDICVFSFHPVKMITTLEGGMATTNNVENYHSMKRLSAHGIAREEKFFSQPPSSPLFYEQIELGYNYRMNDVQAALGISQLKKLDQFVTKRQEIAAYYSQHVNTGDFALPSYKDNRSTSFHLFIVQCLEVERRDFVFYQLRKKNIMCNIHYIPIYRHKYHQFVDQSRISEFDNSEKYYKRAISLPIYPGLKKSEQDFTIETLNALGSYS